MLSTDISDRRKKLLEELSVAGRENSNVVVMFHSAVAARMGLGMTEEKALDLLERLGPLTAGDIAQRAGLAPASVSGLIDRLEVKGFVRRTKGTTDRRRVVVEINYEHIAGFGRLFEGLVAGLTELYAGYSDEQLELILDFLRNATRIQRAATADLEGSA
ncbi:MarR family transcriptional regulator [Nocardia sp. NBC_00508]|uniref:MarR family winged helix-turn-helix transcriptional regulator n=1 Tax=Nocardia sp. NBC_00508 TaxID=2975992 RepID=UPI002E81A0F6|nr:MarR family transcriptional regulator [Nocardia sp. NBC_00508]WUD66065.1 MarR family transcriptional regulator [Nocardia sp. NBC_00508]